MRNIFRNLTSIFGIEKKNSKIFIQHTTAVKTKLAFLKVLENDRTLEMDRILKISLYLVFSAESVRFLNWEAGNHGPLNRSIF